MAGRVLIADDEPNIVTSLEFLMRRNGYDVRIARDGDEAMRVAGAFRPDVVLLDIMMPRRSGADVCRALRNDPALSGVKIVILSAKGRETDVAQGFAAGAHAYVTKPFSTKALVATVRQLMPHEGAA